MQRRMARAATGTFMVVSRDRRVGPSVSRAELGLVPHYHLLLLESDAISSAFYRQPWLMGKWKLGVREEIFQHSGTVILSVTQRRVPGDHRAQDV